MTNIVEKVGISELLVGEDFQGKLLIKNATKGVASNGKPYLTLILSDKTGTLETKVWDVTPNQENDFTAGTVIFTEGTVSEYRGKKQFNSHYIEETNQEVNLAEFLESSPISKGEMETEILDTILDIKNDKIREITLAIIKKYEKQFFEFPAASSMHHAYVSGLAYHTISMLKVAKGLCEVYPELNKDLLFAGVILHDVQKCGEYTGVISKERTLEGKLKGHLVMISEEIGLTAKELKIEGEEVLLLQHLMGSHHGKMEWGAFVLPQLMEAEMLHFIDLIDAKMEMLKTGLAKTEKGQFTEKLFGLDNRSFYKPTL